MKRWWYVLIGPLTLGTLAWTAFLYLGTRAQKRSWLAISGIYLAIAVANGVLTSIAENETDESSIAGFVWIALAGASLAHTLALRGRFEERLEMLEDPVLDAAEDRAERQAHAREMVAEDPGRARKLGIGRPDLEQSFHAGLVDVNSAPTEVIAQVAGITQDAALVVAFARPYSSFEDMDLVVNLPPEQLGKLREVAVFLPVD